MTPGAQREQRFVFGEVAATYHRVRPGYPREVADHILERAGLNARPGDLLEIGAGTGKATLLFADGAQRITALEPSPGMAAVARETLAGLANVAIVESTFESWPGEPGVFDCVYAAQAWHWVPPDVACSKTHSVLRGGALVALFWNRPQHDGHPLTAKLDACYEQHAPSLSLRIKPWQEIQSEGADVALLASGMFTDVVHHDVSHTVTYSAADYVALMETQSDHRLLPDEQRTTLGEALRTVIELDGGLLEVPYVTEITTARTTVAPGAG